MVGKSDFNENSVVSLDLELDFGLGLRACQKKYRFYLKAECRKLFSFLNKKIVWNKTMFEINNSLIASLNMEVKILICSLYNKIYSLL